MDQPTFQDGSHEGLRYKIEETEEGEVARETVEYANFRKQEELHRAFALANVDEADRPYKGKDASGNQAKLNLYIDKFDSKFRSICLYLWSTKNGTQKSTVARWICRRLIERGYTAHFVLMSTLAKALIKRGFEDADEWLLDRVRSVDFLVIDDAFDPRKVTLYKSGYQIPFLDEFLRQRLEMDRRAICFTSNVPITAIDDSFGPSLRSLVRRSVPTPMPMDDEITDFDIADLWT